MDDEKQGICEVAKESVALVFFFALGSSSSLLSSFLSPYEHRLKL